MRVLDLFSGIGGFARAATHVWPDAEMAAFCEVEPFCRNLLAERFPGVPILGDITLSETKAEMDRAQPDLIVGGFPCQDLSLAGRGIGLFGSRSRLFFDMAAVIARTRPRFALIENVPALLSRGLPNVLCELRRIGYCAEWTILSAEDLGAFHRRRRIWILAQPKESFVPLLTAKRGRHLGRTRDTDVFRSDLFGQVRVDSFSKHGQLDGNDVFSCEPVPLISHWDVWPLSVVASGVHQWPTPHANCHTGPGTQGRAGGANLQTAVALWGTPTARDHKDTGDIEERGVPENGLLARQVRPTKDAGSLNPDFTELLMGYPLHWTLPGARISEDAAYWVLVDGRAVPVGVPVLGRRIPYRVPRLQGIGNAIVPQCAAAIMTIVRSHLQTQTNTQARELAPTG